LPKFGTLERYRAVEWINYISTEIHKGFAPLFAAETLVPEEKARDEFKTRVKARLSERLNWVDQQLAGKEYLLGKQFTIGDAYLFTCFSWSKYVDLDTSAWKNLAAWNSRVYARPAVQKAMQSEGLLK
jgi:glutathione S-transferase